MPSEGRYAYQGLDRLLHEKARLGILASLMANPTGLKFVDLKMLCQLTDGNLSRHLQVLQEAGMVAIHKAGGGRRSQTLSMLTPQGRERFQAYLAVLEQVVQDAAASNEHSHQQSSQTPLSSGWITARS